MIAVIESGMFDHLNKKTNSKNNTVNNKIN